MKLLVINCWIALSAAGASAGALTADLNSSSLTFLHPLIKQVAPKDHGNLMVFEQNLPDSDSKPDPKCPPCFNCNLPNFECTQFSQCNAFTGQCECRPGYGGEDCSEPLCGSLESPNNRRPLRKDPQCKCAPGWGGINCNLCVDDFACDSLMPEGLKGTCYKRGVLVDQFHQMCDVTNPKIVEILKGKKPQATFLCENLNKSCNFQFWIAQEELFYCSLDECDFQYDLAKNSTHYSCKTIHCACLPDKMLCGQDGLIDISDFLTETITGPGDFLCDISKQNCRFSEPLMNDLIQSVFGDPYITLLCTSGECLHRSQIPGYALPPKHKFTYGNLALIVGTGLVCLMAVWALVYSISKLPLFALHPYVDSMEGIVSLHENFLPCSLSWEEITYTVKTDARTESKAILKNVSGSAKPGQCLAIMGGSGAGKTTLLDILAGKNKDGEILGQISVNGQQISPRIFKKLVGFVDQEDELISTLTVYETVLNSALLRLPRTMNFRAKEARVLEVLSELRILHIKDSVIGSDFKRGISGGEKRRVSIACELVTSPLILFLDEPTSGLDSYNARNVVDCLVRLLRDSGRTIIFTIHQPRSNIVALFDRLVLLSEGELVYSGDMIKCNDFFTRNGYKCPLGYNIADYLIDITVEQKASEANSEIHQHFVESNAQEIDTTREWEHYAVHRDEYAASTAAANTPEEESTPLDTSITKLLSSLFHNSYINDELKEEIETQKRDVTEINLQETQKKATFLSQLLILSLRTFKNLYRNPRLLLSHYVLSFIMGAFCGFLYYDTTNDISGFQNRLGLFLFVLLLFGFSCLTGLHSFLSERIVFIRERANNYYNPLAYYLLKILCDVIPLRVLPPIILALIAYPLVGLQMEHNAFLKCLLVLVLFNLAVATEVLIIGILVREPGTATMYSVLILLLLLLFAGLFVNANELPELLSWLQWILCFHYAYEALSINEIKDLVLREKKFGLSIEVPGAVILSLFGFNVGAFWVDVLYLVQWTVSFLVLGYIFLHYFAVEKR